MTLRALAGLGPGLGLAGAILAGSAAAADPGTVAPSARAEPARPPGLAERLAAMPVGPPLHRPMTIESQVEGNVVRGTIVGFVDRPLGDLRSALRTAASWCSVLILHVNNKDCRVGPAGSGSTLSLRVARKPEQPVEHAYELVFQLRIDRSTADALSMRLESSAGPLGTSDYRIGVDATPAGESRSLVKLSYAYRQSAITAWAMDLYLATIGSGKVGFSPATEGSGKPVAGVRGITERNLMRYFLAVQVASHTPHAVDDGAYRVRLNEWFEATERYPVQLRELSREDYLALKVPLRAVGVVAEAYRP